jgi:catalase
VRLRPESFADHYSQARQFYISQTGAEQRHIASALTFELSKVETPAIRERMVSHNEDRSVLKVVSSAFSSPMASMPSC